MKKFLINNLVQQNLRIDKWLRINFSSLNQGFIEKNIRKGNIKINNKKIVSRYVLKNNDEISIYNYSQDKYFNQPKILSKKTIPSKYLDFFKRSILYEDSNFIILDKWTGIATQGGSKINISIDHIIKNISENYNLVHRLDRETSGLLIVAKNYQYTKIFGKLFKDKLIQKTYIATCQGKPKHKESKIELGIIDKKNPDKKSNSVTGYKVYQTLENLSNIIFTPKTGKTHQIRIVAKHLGCPIVGDTKYNRQNKFNFEKLKLNAHILQFNLNNKDFKFISTLPNHFDKFFKKYSLKKIILKL